MANNLKSMINVIANEEAITNLEERLKNVKYSDVTSFAKAFYDDVEMSGDGVLNEWSLNNIGSKWTTFSDDWGGGEFVIESAWYPPKEFFIHLYKLMFEIDPEVMVEVKFEDETYNPVGGFVAKKDSNGDSMWAMNEDDELSNPTDDMDFDDEGFDDAQMEFMDEVSEAQDRMVELCHEQINDFDGYSIDEV